MTTLSVIIPAYNEELGILEIARRVLSVKEKLVNVGVDQLELLIVDDGSKDNTAQIACQIEGVHLIRHSINRGYGAALKTGFLNACGDLIGFLDADGTYPPEYFPELCQEALRGSQLVIGSRMAGAESQMPATRRVGNFFFANLLTLVGRQRVSDSASGMRVFQREVLERIFPLPDGLNLTPVMSTRAIHEGIKVTEIPIPYSERLGRSKLSVVRDGIEFFQSIVWTALSYNPVRIFGLAGLGGIGLALLGVIALVVARLRGVTTLDHWSVAALFWVMVSAVSGISIFSFGATSNYFVSLFYKKPIRQGLLGRPLFAVPLERRFGWLGLLSFVAGLGLAILSLALSLGGWEITRLWFYLLFSAMLILVGIQLIIFWLLMRLLEELSRREILAGKDLNVA